MNIYKQQQGAFFHAYTFSITMKTSFYFIALLMLIALLISGCATPQDAPQKPAVTEFGSTAGLVDIYDAKDVDVKPAAGKGVRFCFL